MSENNETTVGTFSCTVVSVPIGQKGEEKQALLETVLLLPEGTVPRGAPRVW